MANNKVSGRIANDWWGYVVLFSRFMIFFMDSGISKSFGVLIPRMVERLGENYATIGLLSSLPVTVLFLACKYTAVGRFYRRKVRGGGGGSLPLEVVPHPRGKKTREMGMFFRGGRGTRVTRKGCQNHERLEKWYLTRYDQSSKVCVIL